MSNTEPEVTYATVRESGDDDWIDIECRFDDGQKFAAVQVDADFDRLAHLIAEFLSLDVTQRNLVETVADQNREIEQFARGVSITKDADIAALKRDLRQAAEHFAAYDTCPICLPCPAREADSGVGETWRRGRQLHKPDCWVPIAAARKAAGL